jgi:hypothetical protein
MLATAAVEFIWSEAAIPLLGLGIFLAIIVRGQSRPTRAGSLVVLTLLVTGWLFAEALVWRQQWPSMLRAADSYAYRPPEWEWTALLVLTYAGVLTLAASLRLLAAGRRELGWACAGSAFILFGAWTAIVNYAAMLGVVTASMAAVAVWADSRSRWNPPRPAARRDTTARVLAISAASLVIVLWLLLAAAWAFFAGSSGDLCQCWAQQPDSWHWTAEILIALAGSAGIAVMLGGWLRRNRALLVVASVVAASALAGWLVFYVPALGLPNEGTVAPVAAGRSIALPETGWT